MDTPTRSKLTQAIMTIVGILLAALLGWLAGCSATWSPQRSQLKFLWPDRDVHVQIQTSNGAAATQPAEEPAP